jgi:hypothetical protein
LMKALKKFEYARSKDCAVPRKLALERRVTIELLQFYSGHEAHFQGITWLMYSKL